MNRSRLVNTFITLAKITSPSFKEAEIIRKISNKLKFLDVSLTKDSASIIINGNADNLVATLAATDKSMPPIALVAHVDTVEPCSHCQPIVTDTAITSDGTTVLGADDKAGVAIMIELLETLLETHKPHGLIQCIFTVAEEKGLMGAKNMDFDLVKSRDIIVLDGDGPAGTVINKAPSQNSFYITIKGKAAHAGVDPQKGVNAIQAAAKAIAGLDIGRIDHETTNNIGIIKGGSAGNIVPDLVYVEAEVRSHDPAKLKINSKLIKDAFMQNAKTMGGKCDIKEVVAYESFSIEKDNELIRRIDAAASLCHTSLTLQRSGGGSDANVFNAKGFNAVNFGIGYENVHTQSESLDIEQFHQASLIIEALVTGS